MSDVRDFVIWFGSILVVTSWIGDLINGYTQYAGTLTGLLLALWISFSAGSIIFLAIRRLLCWFSYYAAGVRSASITVDTRILSRELKLGLACLDLLLKGSSLRPNEVWLEFKCDGSRIDGVPKGFDSRIVGHRVDIES